MAHKAQKHSDGRKADRHMTRRDPRDERQPDPPRGLVYDYDHETQEFVQTGTATFRTMPRKNNDQ